MNKKILLATITLFASFTMLVGCSTTETDPADTTSEVATDTTNDATATEDTADLTEDMTGEMVEGEMGEMENIEMTEEEMLALLGLDEAQETFAEGELAVEFGVADTDSFDVVYDATDFTFGYNSSQWIESGFAIDGTEVVLVDSNPVDFEAPANIYITPVSYIPSYISINEYLQMVVDSSLSIMGVEILSSGVDFVGDYQVGMLETVERYTEEILDEMIELGYITEEDIEAIGGREVLLSFPDMYQIFMIARNGEDVYTFSGAYYSNDIKRDELIEATDGFLSTLTPKVSDTTSESNEVLDDTDTEEDSEEDSETDTE